MAFNDYISRTDADVLIPVEQSREILQTVCDTNWLLQKARRLANMGSKVTSMPVLSSLPVAGFVNGDTGLKPTTDVSWDEKFITAEELACIIPIPEAVLDDSSYDIWANIKPLIVDGFNIPITGAILYGTNIPSTWTTNMGAAGLVAFATAAGSTASLATFTDFYEAVEGESGDGNADGLLALLEADGFQSTGHVAHVSVKSRMRNCRDANGQRIYPNTSEIDGVGVVYPDDGTIDSSEAYDIAGDWRQLVYAIREDMSYKVLDQAIIQDASGNIIHNLAQQDMVALRCKMRIGVALPNPINRMEETEASRSPFALLVA